MEKNEVITLEDRGFIEISGPEAKDFLQNIVTNDIEKVTNNSTIFSSILTPQGKYLFEFFVLKLKDSYLLECEKKSAVEIIKLLNFYKLRSKVDFIDLSEKYVAAVISLEKFKDIEIGKVLIGNPYTFALIKVVEPDLKEFTNTELICGKSKVKILKPEWI